MRELSGRNALDHARQCTLDGTVGVVASEVGDGMLAEPVISTIALVNRQVDIIVVHSRRT